MPEGNPTIKSLNSVLDALGLKLSIEPKEPSEKGRATRTLKTKKGTRTVVRVPCKMVDRAGVWTNTSYVYDSIAFVAVPKKLNQTTFAEKYTTSNHTAAQIAQIIGVSKQTALKRIRAARVPDAKGRARSPENYCFPKTNPFGKKVLGGRLVVDPTEMKIARLVVEYRDRNGATWAKICLRLNEKGYRNRRGTEWKDANVRHVHKLWSGKL